MACFGQRAGGRPSKQPISRDTGLVGVIGRSMYRQNVDSL